MQLSFPASVQKRSAIFDRVLWVDGTAVFLPGRPRPKLPLGLCHLEEKNTCSVLPLPTGRDSLPASETARGGPTPYSCSPVFKQTHPRRQLFSSQMKIAEQQKAHPDQLQSARRVQDIFQAQERGHRSTFSSLHCSPQGQEAARGQARRARATFGPASPTGAGFRQLAICSR